MRRGCKADEDGEEENTSRGQRGGISSAGTGLTFGDVADGRHEQNGIALAADRCDWLMSVFYQSSHLIGGSLKVYNDWPSAAWSTPEQRLTTEIAAAAVVIHTRDFPP